MKKKIIIYLIIFSLVVSFKVGTIMSSYQAENLSNLISGSTAPRGRILDRNGNILADNIGVKSLIYNKLDLSIEDEKIIIKKLAQILSFNEEVSPDLLRRYYYLLYKEKVDNLVSKEILQKYNERMITSSDLLNIKYSLITSSMIKKINPKEAYLYYLMNKGYSYEDKIIKEGITNSEYTLINNAHLKGIRTELTWERYYPYGKTLRDVLGSVSSFEEGIPYELSKHYLSKGYNLSDRVGINNLEYVYDDYLKGTKAIYKVDNNYLTLVKNSTKGHDLVLNLDLNLQMEIEKIMEEEMIKAKKGANTKYYNSSYLVVSNPNTGGIIALIGKEINNDGSFNDISYDNALSSFTVGSVVKGASISVGYKYNLIDNHVIDGCIKLKNQLPKCSWKSLGVLNDLNALKMSSNYYQYLIAVKLTGHKYIPNLELQATSEHFNIYRKMFASYGLGVKTNIDLSNESTGQKGITISDDLLLNFTIGQYDTYTPLELSSYINTIAKGERKELKLAGSILNNDGTILQDFNSKLLSKPDLNEEYLERIRLGFHKVNTEGTGYGYVNNKYSSAGKTGTSESFLDTDNNGIIDTKTITSSYVMYAPYENPLVSVILVSPHIKYDGSGSNYTYPINYQIMKRVSQLVIESYT